MPPEVEAVVRLDRHNAMRAYCGRVMVDPNQSRPGCMTDLGEIRDHDGLALYREQGFRKRPDGLEEHGRNNRTSVRRVGKGLVVVCPSCQFRNRIPRPSGDLRRPREASP